MTYILVNLVAIGLFSLTPATTFAKSAPAKESAFFVLEKLAEDEAPSGCSCSIKNSKNEFIFNSDLLEKSYAIVRVEGRKRNLKWHSSTEKGGELKKNDTFTREYGDGKMKLKLNYKAMFVCPVDSETCEVTRYSIQAILQEGSKKSDTKNLRGECGC